MARLLERVELIAHVIDRGLEQLSDRRYWPCRHVRGPGSHYQPHPFRPEIAVAVCGFWTEADEAAGTGEPGPGSGPNAELRHMNQEIARVGMRRFTGVYRSGCNLRQTTNSGDALKIELYVPDTMPISRASAKPFKVSPPATRIATRTRTTVKLVMIDRTAVCMMLMFTTCSNESLWLTRRFSRIRSKTTMVSWTEKPTTVSTAVTKRLLISPIRRWSPVPRMAIAATMTERRALRIVSPAIVPPTSSTFRALASIGPTLAVRSVTSWVCCAVNIGRVRMM